MSHIIEEVSIIMPAYNASSSIGLSIQSVIDQNYKNWHLYIIDDASVDDTSDVIGSFCDPRITFIKMPVNRGVSNARNIGIEKAQGKYIAFLDSDDLWVETKLEKQIKILENGHDVVCSNYSIFSVSIDDILSARRFSEKLSYDDMLVSNKIGNLTGIYNQLNVGKVFQQEHGHEDYIMWLEIINKAKNAHCVQETLAYYRVSPHSLSGNKVKACCWQWSVYRNYLRFGFSKSTYYLFRYIVASLSR